MIQTKYPKTFKVVKIFYSPMLWFFEKNDVATDHIGRTILILTIFSLLLSVVFSFFQPSTDAIINAAGIYAYFLGSVSCYSLVMQERDAIMTRLMTENEPPRSVRDGY